MFQTFLFLDGGTFDDHSLIAVESLEEEALVQVV